MTNTLRWSSVISGGLVVESAEEYEGVMVVCARSTAEQRQCPRCGRSSGRVHSRYVRTIVNLPCVGRNARLRLLARRFVRDARLCQQPALAELFPDTVTAESSRLTSRLKGLKWLTANSLPEPL